MLPFADPQFWIVTAAAALGFVLRRVRRRKPAGELPCANCPKAKSKIQ